MQGAYLFYPSSIRYSRLWWSFLLTTMHCVSQSFLLAFLDYLFLINLLVSIPSAFFKSFASLFRFRSVLFFLSSCWDIHLCTVFPCRFPSRHFYTFAQSNSWRKQQKKCSKPKVRNKDGCFHSSNKSRHVYLFVIFFRKASPRQP